MQHDTTPTVPPGYITAAQLAAEYSRNIAAVRHRLRYDHVPHIRLERRNAAGTPLGGHKILAYNLAAAHASLQRPHQRLANGSAPGYIGLLANTYNLTRQQVRDILATYGIQHQQRICPCCGKSTLFYPKRHAAVAALNTWKRKQTQSDNT